MSKVDIVSGFLGAGKTTLIKKLLKESWSKEQVVLIENEFGEIGIDGSFLKEAGITIREMNSGCICCSLVGDFSEALKKVTAEFHPDRIVIEPSGVGKLSDVVRAVQQVDSEEIELNSFVTVVDAGKCRMYMKNFGEFFNNQIEFAGTILLSRTESQSEENLESIVQLLRKHNANAQIITTPWKQLKGEQIVQVMEQDHSLKEELLEEAGICPVCGHHHEHHQHEENECAHHHGENAHHHEHHADDIFTSWGKETVRRFTREELEALLSELEDTQKFGMVLRAKGILEGKDQEWLYFDYVPKEIEIRSGAASYTGRLCVIGSGLNESALEAWFQK